jgi:hypothetical protein
MERTPKHTVNEKDRTMHISSHLYKKGKENRIHIFTGLEMH